MKLGGVISNPKALRTHILRLLGPKTIPKKGSWAIVSLRVNDSLNPTYLCPTF